MIIQQHPQLFFSRQDSNSLNRMHALFEKEGNYFIEKTEDQTWLHKDWVKGVAINTTNNPHEAMVFKTKMKAMTFAVKYGFCKPDGWDITEHIFDSPTVE